MKLELALFLFVCFVGVVSLAWVTVKADAALDKKRGECLYALAKKFGDWGPPQTAWATHECMSSPAVMIESIKQMGS